MPRVLIVHSDEPVRCILARLTCAVRADAQVVSVQDVSQARDEFISKKTDLAVFGGYLIWWSVTTSIAIDKDATPQRVANWPPIILVASQPDDAPAFEPTPLCPRWIIDPCAPREFRSAVREALRGFPPSTPCLARRIDEWIREKCAQHGLRAVDACEEFTVSRSYLYELLFRHFKMGFTKRLLYHRVTRSKELMALSPDRPLLKQVAADCGFRTPARFSEAFKRYQGLPPSRFLDRFHDQT